VAPIASSEFERAKDIYGLLLYNMGLMDAFALVGALFATAFIPGLGHFYFGMWKRGLKFVGLWALVEPSYWALAYVLKLSTFFFMVGQIIVHWSLVGIAAYDLLKKV